MNEILIDLGERSYKIHIDTDLLANSGKIISDVCSAKNVAVISNASISKKHSDKLIKSLADSGIDAHLIIIPAGERYKTLKTVAGIYEKLLDHKIDRSGAVIGLGGGIVGDITGFAAATWLRGVDFIQIPTSLLAQVDASVGGKTGVNVTRGKNLVGSFYQPKTVIIDISVLKTLPAREYKSGLAEVIKHGIIRDRDYFDYIEKNINAILRMDPEILGYLIEVSCRIKSEVVSLDEHESGLRKILNYGHTVGHAIERLTGYRRYKHGEAVSIGMVSAAFAADEVGSVEPYMIERLISLLSAVGLPVKFNADIKYSDIIDAMKIDKKVSHGKLDVVLSREIGLAYMDNTVSESAWISAFKRQSVL